MSWRWRSRMDKGGLASHIRNENDDEGCPVVPKRARSAPLGPPETRAAAFATNKANTSWLFVILGEHQVVAQLIAKRALMPPLIYKDFPVCTLSSLVAIRLP